MQTTPIRSSVPLPWSYPTHDSDEISIQTSSDRRFISDGTCGLKSDFQRMEIAAKAAHQDLILEIEPTLPLPTKSFENLDRYEPGDVLKQGGFYRRPDYLLLTDKETSYRLRSIYLNCFCMRFWGESKENFKCVNPKDFLKSPYIDLRKILEDYRADVLVVTYNDDFKGLHTFLKKYFPDKLLLILCDDDDRFKNDDEEKYDKIAEGLREQGFYAFSHKEVMDRQEYVSRLIAHGLSKAGIDRLKINPIIV